MNLEKIPCFLIEKTERTFTAGGVTRAVYSDGKRDFHIGTIDMVAPDGERLPCAPVGAMWDADWLHGLHESNGLQCDRNEDGKVLILRCPGGDWCIDGASNTGGSWSRCGVAPKLTVTPSILQRGKYHGWLRDGFLAEL